MKRLLIFLGWFVVPGLSFLFRNGSKWKMPFQPEEVREARMAVALSCIALVFYVKVYSAYEFTHQGVEAAVLIVIVVNFLTFITNLISAEVS